MNEKDRIQAIYRNFYQALNTSDKNECLSILNSVLEKKELSIDVMYEAILEKSLYEIARNDKKQAIGIWQEHIQSGIIRTLIENTYKYVLEEKAEPINQKVLLFCPKEEYHDLGARMTSDFLTLLGFETYFIGPNTPEEEVFNAIDILKPDWVSISVTNFFHLSKLQDLVIKIKEYKNLNIKVMVGGYAIEYTPSAKESIQAHAFPYTFKDLSDIKEAYYETRL